MKKTLNSFLVFLLALVVFIVPSRVEVEAASELTATMESNVPSDDNGVTGDITSKVNLENPFTATAIGSVHIKTGSMNPFNKGSIKVEISEGYIITKLSFSKLEGGASTVKIGENPNEDVKANAEFLDLNITSFSIQHKIGKASEFGAITITYAKDGMDVDIRATFDGANPDVPFEFSGLEYNDTITVDSGTHAGYEFAFWVVDGIVRHDLVTPNQTFYARNNLTAIAVYHPTDKHAVLFVDHSGKFIETKYVVSGSVTEPTALPDKVGYKHAEPNKWLSLTGSGSIANITENTVFKLQYERVTEDTFTINLTGATQSSITANYNDIVTVTSDLVGFTHWEEDGKVVSYSEVYKFSALSNRTLVAKADGGTRTPLVTLGNDLALRPGYVSRVAQVELPVGYELLEYGYLISGSTDILTIENATIANSSAMVDVTNEYLTTFKDTYTNIRAYAIVIKDGVIEHVYSELDKFSITLSGAGLSSNFETDIEYNTEVTLTINVPEGKLLDELTINGQAVDVVDNKYIFRIKEDIIAVVSYFDKPEPSDLMIYEIYGSGGNTNATYKNDYVVLYNNSDAAIDLNGYSLQYAASVLNSKFTIAGELTGSIASKGYYVIKLAGGTNGEYLPVIINFEGTTNMAMSDGKVVLASGIVPIVGLQDTAIVDYVAYGDGLPFLGTGSAPKPDATNSIKRGSFVNTMDNATDFVAGVIDLSYLPQAPVATVSFITNGGTPETSPVIVVKGHMVSQPSVSLTGKTLVGWFTDSGFVTEWNFSDPVNADMTLYAKWEDIPADVTIETFDNSNATSSYATSSFIGVNGITWSYVASRDGNGDANNSGINLPALMFTGNTSAKITSSKISGGIGSFNVKLYKGFTGGGDRQVELFINGISQGTSTPFDDFNEHVFEVKDINIAGDFTIEIKNKTSKQVIIDDISWTDFTPSNAEKLQMAQAEVEELYAGKSFNMETAVELPTTSELGVAIAWVMDPTDAIAAGKWKVVTADTPVTLTATLSIGTETPVDVTLNVTIVFVDDTIVEEVTYSTGFENSTKGSYATGTLDIDGVNWELNEALIGGLANDKFNGKQAVRIRNSGGFLESKETFASISKISFEAANYGTKTGGTLKIEVSTDGETWITIEEGVSLGSDLATYTFDVTETGPLYIKITKTAGERVNIDDLKIYSII